MGRSTRPSLQRYRQIEARQGSQKWLADYEPAIYSTREEAPSKSRPCLIYSEKIGRDLHALSAVEQDLFPLALYHPGLGDIQEQKVIPTIPSPHPLQTHPDCAGLKFPTMRGTVAIAESLGWIKHHPMISVPDPDNPELKMIIPFPWIGDALLYMQKRNFMYCVNWTCKYSSAQFEDPRAMGEHVRNVEKKKEQLRARHAIEAICYADVGIPTHRITKDDYDRHVIQNLRQIYGWHNRATPFDPIQSEIILDHFKAGLLVRISPLIVMQSLMMRFRFRLEDLKAAFYQAVWHRKLRIDLHDAFGIDIPMRPEKSDILSDYANWFSEG